MPAPSHQQGYLCVGCKAPLTLDKVKAARQFDQGQVVITYCCDCSDRDRHGRYPLIPPYLMQLFGRLPKLPWQTPIHPQLVEDDHPSLVRMRKILAGSATPDDFLVLEQQSH